MSQYRSSIHSRIYCGPSGVAGIGIHAGVDIKKGEHIFTLRGEEFDFQGLIDAKGAQEVNAYQVDKNLYIYSSDPEGNYANHCCEPNAGMVDRDMVAIKDIAKDEEILFDYSTTISESYFSMQCACGAKNCRRTVGDFHDLPENLQQHYVGLGIVQRFILRELEERANGQLVA